MGGGKRRGLKTIFFILKAKKIINTTIIHSYFPRLLPQQQEQFALLESLYGYWNERINLISRKDIAELYERHVLHSLAIARCVNFAPATSILDVGTGGGFPGIPLAILFPQCRFTLVDSIGKKLLAVAEIAKSIHLQNVDIQQIRVEKMNAKFDFVVARAVSDLQQFLTWTWDKIIPAHTGSLPNGILYLKGGDLAGELNALPCQPQIFDISQWFGEPFFETKKVVYIAKNY
ncbi:ribosomal RNA small subunit methyltransferase G [Bacteroidia bacterium]|nr:ribosomal RNA small subunit methyltransferase G [Bacteroidia bacterium]